MQVRGENEHPLAPAAVMAMWRSSLSLPNVSFPARGRARWERSCHAASGGVGRTAWRFGGVFVGVVLFFDGAADGRLAKDVIPGDHRSQSRGAMFARDDPVSNDPWSDPVDAGPNVTPMCVNESRTPKR